MISDRNVVVTESDLAQLVEAFYAKVQAHQRLGPIFARVVEKENWPRHLATIKDFWSSMMLTSGRYKGNPMLAHMRVEGVRPDDFEIWLALFSQTCDELFSPELADALCLRASRVAQSLQMGMFHRPGTDPLRVVAEPNITVAGG